MFKTEIYIENQRVDLFEDEGISIVSSVQNIEDISRIFNDFSQSFTVPASKNNNKIFKHFYNASINNGFDGRVRHTARIEMNGTPFKTGTIRLEACKIENNNPVHYKITYFGQLIDLKEKIGDEYLNALDLSIYDFEYNSDNIITGLTTGYFNKDYVIPLISTERQWLYNSAVADDTFTDKLTNIAWNGSTADHGINWSSLRPALKVMRIIEAIESTYEIEFTRDFLGTAPFDDLYLWLSNADSEDALKNISKVTDYATGDFFDGIFLQPTGLIQPGFGSFNNSTGTFSPNDNSAPKLRQINVRVGSSDGVQYTVQLMNGDTVLKEQTSTIDNDFDHELPQGVDPGSSIYLRIVVNTDKTIDDLNIRIKELSNDTLLFVVKTSFDLVGSTAKVIDFIPKIKVFDFLKSIISWYNLVVVPITENNFYINTLDKWYIEGKIYNISAYINTEETTIERGKIYREISFKNQEPQTILAEQLAKTNNTAYGDLETKLKNNDGKNLDGDEFEIETDFEQMVYERLFNINDKSTTNIVYGLSLDIGLDEATPEPHLLYIRQLSVSANPISVVQDTGIGVQLNGNVFMPSHTNSGTKDYSTAFGSEIDEHTGTDITNSLFKLYYEDYVQDTFSIKRRRYSLNAKFPIWLLNQLKLNDKLVIGTDRYIINKMTTNINDGMVQLELLNDIYNLTTDVEVQEEAPPNPTPPPRVTPIKAKSFSISSTGATTRDGGCSLSVGTTKYWLGSEGNPTLADVIYNEQARTNKFNGGSLYYKIGDNLTIRISSEGVVIDVFDCTGGGIQ